MAILIVSAKVLFEIKGGIEFPRFFVKYKYNIVNFDNGSFDSTSIFFAMCTAQSTFNLQTTKNLTLNVKIRFVNKIN